MRKYLIKESWIFNLESMDDKLWTIREAISAGEITPPLLILGYTISNEEDVNAVMDEAQNLTWIAKTRKVSSAEYGRIKQFVEWRVEQRYFRCISSGMNEADASVCFEDI